MGLKTHLPVLYHVMIYKDNRLETHLKELQLAVYNGHFLQSPSFKL